MAQEKCVARSSRTGKRCSAWPIRGGTVCVAHGGAAPQVKAAAERRLARAETRRVLEKLTNPDGELTDPVRALQRLGGRIDEWVARLEEMIEHREGRVATIDNNGVVRISPEAELLRGYLGDLAKVATTLAKLPIEERVAASAELAASHEWRRVRTAILEALEPHPEAQNAVLQALQGLSEAR